MLYPKEHLQTISWINPLKEFLRCLAFSVCWLDKTPTNSISILSRWSLSYLAFLQQLILIENIYSPTWIWQKLETVLSILVTTLPASQNKFKKKPFSKWFKIDLHRLGGKCIGDNQAESEEGVKRVISHEYLNACKRAKSSPPRMPLLFPIHFS